MRDHEFIRTVIVPLMAGLGIILGGINVYYISTRDVFEEAKDPTKIEKIRTISSPVSSADVYYIKHEDMKCILVANVQLKTFGDKVKQAIGSFMTVDCKN